MTSSLKVRRFLLFTALILGILSIYMIGLGSSPLIDPDEPIYGQFIKEMVMSGNWLTPHFNGNIWFDKPPLIYWLASICVLVGGLSEFTLRLPSAVFGALTVIMVFFLACHDFGKKAGALAAAIVGTTLLQIVLVHGMATDSIMVSFMVCSLYFYRRWLDSSGKESILWMAGCGAAAGFGLLTKGPSVPLLLLMTFIIHLLWIRQIKRIWSVGLLVGVVVSLLIGLPWYAAMLRLHGNLFIEQFIIANNVTRFQEPLHKSQDTNWYSHLKTLFLLFALFLPWNVYLIQAVKRCWRMNTGAKLASVWIFSVLLLFSLSSTQNFTYSYPAFPACAILVGAYLVQLTEQKNGRAQMVTGLAIGLVIAVLVGIELYIAAGRKYSDLEGFALILGATLLITYLVPLSGVLMNRMDYSRAPWLIAAGMTLFGLLTVGVVTPVIARYMSCKDISRQIRTMHPADIVSYNLWRPGMLYYTDTMPEDLENESDLQELSSSRKPIVLVTEIENDNTVSKYGLTKLYSESGLNAYANEKYVKLYNLHIR